jgi:hypothetical protein
VDGDIVAPADGHVERHPVTKAELFNQLKIDLGKGEGQQEVHLVDWTKRKRELKANPQKSTKVVFDTKSAESWSALQLQKDRYFTIGKDPHISTLLVIRALAAFGDQVLRDWVSQGIDGVPDPPENLPEWLKP